MGVVVPVGECVATFLFVCDASPKTVTWSLGFQENYGSSVSDFANQIYDKWRDTDAGGPAPFEPGAMSNDWTFTGVSLMEMTGSGPLVGQWLQDTPGTDVNASMPMNCTELMTKNTALGGRKNRGRAYIPPVHIGEGAVDVGGNIGPGGAAQVSGYFDNVWLFMLTDAWVPVLHHSDGSAGTPITGMACSSLIATQRRRIR